MGEAMPAFPKRQKASGAQAGGGQALLNPLGRGHLTEKCLGAEGLGGSGVAGCSSRFCVARARGDVRCSVRKGQDWTSSGLFRADREEGGGGGVFAARVGRKGAWSRYRSFGRSGSS